MHEIGTQITPPRVPIIDDRTGLISREWYRFFLGLYNLTSSGSSSMSLEDLQLAAAQQPFDEQSIKQAKISIDPAHIECCSVLEQLCGTLPKDVSAAPPDVIENLMGRFLDVETRKRIEALEVLPPVEPKKDTRGFLSIMDTTASVTLPTTPTVYVAPTLVVAEGVSYDTATGVTTINRSASYFSLNLFVNADPSAANKYVYIYLEYDVGGGWTIDRYSARQSLLPSLGETQIQSSASRNFPIGTKIRYYVWGDATVYLKTTELPGTTAGTVTVPAYRYTLSGTGG